MKGKLNHSNQDQGVPMKQIVRKMQLGLLICLMLTGICGIKQISAAQYPVYEPNSASKPQNIPSHNEAEIAAGLLKNPTIPSTGNVRTLVVMAEFSDVKFAETYTEEYVKEMMFAEPDETAENYPKESLNAWYQRSSFGKLSFYGDVLHITLPETRQYYTYDAASNPFGEKRYWDAVWAQLETLGINWSDYDSNQDYVVDALYFITAGKCEAWTGQWWSYTRYDEKIMDDKYKVKSYGQSMEEHMSNPSIAIHEFSHGLGLPDLYNTELEVENHVGAGICTSDMLSTNSTDFNALCKFMLGWIDEGQIQKIPYGSNPTTVTLESYTRTGSCAMVSLDEGNTSIFGEYYLIQYEDFYGNDSELASFGGNEEHLRIYHVNAELNQERTGFLYDNSTSGGCKLIEAVDKDYEFIHTNKYLVANDASASVFASYFTPYDCGYVAGDELTPYSAPSTGKYAEDGLPASPDVFSGLNIIDIQIGKDKAAFQVSYEAAPSEAAKLSIIAVEDLNEHTINGLEFQAVANHDIWITDQEKSAYIRKKGDTAVIAKATLDMQRPWYGSYETLLGGGHYSFYVKFDTTLEYDTEYEIVFPAGLFVTSYGALSEEVILSGIHTEMNFWDTKTMQVKLDSQEYLYASEDVVINEENNLEIAACGVHGGLYIVEIERQTGEILDIIQVASEDEAPEASYISSFGQGKNGNYWIFYSKYKYIVNREGKVLYYEEDETETCDGIRLNENQVAVTGINQEFSGKILDLDKQEVISVTDESSGAIFSIGNLYLIGNRENGYKIYDSSGQFVREMNLDGLSVVKVEKTETGYFLFGNKDGNIYVCTLDSQLYRTGWLLAWEAAKLQDVHCLDGGYLWCITQNGIEMTYIMDSYFNPYNRINFAQGYGGNFFVNEKQYMLSYSFLGNTIYYQESIALEIPEGKGNALDSLKVSEQIVLDEKGYVNQGKVISSQAYLEAIISKTDEVYSIQNIDNQCYLKVTSIDGTVAAFYKLNCVHIWNQGKLESVATCTNSGKKVYQCIVCKEPRAETLSPLGHVFAKEWTIDKEATCIEAGSKSHHCNRMGCTVKSDETEIPAGGHSWDAGIVTTEADCITAGERTYHCINCNISKTEVIHANGHDYENAWLVEKEASCTETGIQSLHCRICEKVDDTSYTEIPVKEHSWDAGTVTKAAGCTKNGEKTYYCTVCKATKKETLSENGHSYGIEWVTDQIAGCTENGSKSLRCTVCGAADESTRTEIPMTGHSWEKETDICKICKVKKTEDTGLQNPKSVKPDSTDTEKEVYVKLVRITGVKNTASGQITVKYTKGKNINGYQIQYATVKSMKKAKTVTASAKSSSKVIKKLGKKTYYVRIRVYRKVDGVKHYSSWSKIKKIVVKK